MYRLTDALINFKLRAEMDNLIATLMLWISSNTTYDVTQIQPPEIRLVSPYEITSEYYRGSDEARPESGIDARIFALYNAKDAKNGIIFLVDPRLTSNLSMESADTDESVKGRSKLLHREWLENPVFQEQLLHELIHHVQHQTGAINQFPCPAYGEREAYLLGGKYLNQRYVGDPLPNRKLLAYRYGHC